MRTELTSQRKPAPLFGQRDLGIVGIGTVEELRVAQEMWLGSDGKTPALIGTSTSLY